MTTRMSPLIVEQATFDKTDKAIQRMEYRKQLIRQTWRAVEHGLDVKATQLFYARLFNKFPETKPMFEGIDMSLQSLKLYEVLRVAVRFIERLDELIPTLQDLGVRHISYGVKREHYEAVTTVFVDVLTSYVYSQWPTDLATFWRHDVAEAWAWLLNTVGKIMADAADDKLAQQKLEKEEKAKTNPVEEATA